jgi:hypothetical protein
VVLLGDVSNKLVAVGLIRFGLFLVDAKFSKHILACLTLIGILSSSLISSVDDQRPLLIKLCFGCFTFEFTML